MRVAPPELDPPGETRLLLLYGSHAHGTATATSDEDWRGVFQSPNDDFLGLYAPQQTWERKPDIVMWELAQFCRLLLKGNPNIVGMLWIPEDCLYKSDEFFAALQANRRAFITRPMASAYIGWLHTELAQGEKLTSKRLSHLIRLVFELHSALERGELTVRPTGNDLDYIMQVKRGEVPFTEVAELVTEMLPMLREVGHGLPEPPTGWLQQLLLETRQAGVIRSA